MVVYLLLSNRCVAFDTDATNYPFTTYWYHKIWRTPTLGGTRRWGTLHANSVNIVGAQPT